VIHLDTSFLVDLLREERDGSKGPARGLLQDELEDDELAACVHVVSELFAGVELSSRRRDERARVEELCGLLRIVYPDDEFAPAYGKLLAATRRSGEPIGTMDLLIGTAAVIGDAPLVTRDARDFRRIPGLELIEYG